MTRRPTVLAWLRRILTDHGTRPEHGPERVALGGAYARSGWATLAAGLAARPPLGAREAAHAAAAGAEAPDMADGELVAVALAAVDLDDDDLARLLSRPHHRLTAADIGRFASAPGDVPLVYWPGLAELAAWRAPAYEMCATALKARAQMYALRLADAALGTIRDRYTPEQLDAASHHYAQACVQSGAPLEVAMHTLPASELEPVARTVGESIRLLLERRRI